MKTFLTIAVSLAATGIALAYSSAENATESKKPNDFFEKCWDETVSRQGLFPKFVQSNAGTYGNVRLTAYAAQLKADESRDSGYHRAARFS